MLDYVRFINFLIYLSVYSFTACFVLIVFIVLCSRCIILTLKLPVPSPLLSFILNLTTATHSTTIFYSLR